MTSTPASASNHQHHTPTSSAEFSSHPNSNTHAHAHPSHLDSSAQLATTGYAPNDNQLAGLVEAATAAAGQDVSEWAAAAAVAAAAGAAGGHHQLDGYGGDIHIGDDGFGDAGFGGLGGGKTMRGSGSASGEQGHAPERSVSKKRKRGGEDPLDPALTAASAGVGFGTSQHQHQHQHERQQQESQQQQARLDGEDLDMRGLPAQSMSDIRAAGVHSAAALFRQPSSNKKYTRPPMSKLFSSLELSPENFLHLQAAAKAYMLDENHPERRDCVGQRGKGDTEMVKLRLWNCVRNFLETEGNGERFFGENVVNEGIGPRTHVWPRDQQKIISLVIPLLRRMVTNERQRQYAIETRKGGGTEERKRKKMDDSLQRFSPSQQYSTEEQLQMHHQSQQNHLPDDYTAPPPLPPIPAQIPVQGMELGLTDLLTDGYQATWDAIARSYEVYNQNYELDSLWAISGLQQQDWKGLVAAVDSHYQIVHNGGYGCPSVCEDAFINHIINSNSASNLPWRIGGSQNQPAKNEFASSIIRDISRVVRDALSGRRSEDHPIVSPHVPPPSAPPSAAVGMEQQSHIPNSSSSPQQAAIIPSQHYNPTGENLAPPAPNNQAVSSNTASTSGPSSLINLYINILQNSKRIIPQLSLPADQCPDLGTLRDVITRRYPGQITLQQQPVQGPLSLPSASSDPDSGSWRVKVWLPDGLASVSSDGEWTVALLSAGNVDWMDGSLKVLVDVAGESR
ncbi:hypothetical protein MPDQ_005447 [Monascus purpureus]|uniref:Uncharacterized protein n=1 Tax=Monascus purpureus TaxID=5098 RepID=A0A507QYP9_MONPU|nr:hypothetical protein MPDQ_005447 [Monascus purpureus]BDD57808.1 hypothetical protein MAP00_003142 [Monascus purpureus]